MAQPKRNPLNKAVAAMMAAAKKKKMEEELRRKQRVRAISAALPSYPAAGDLPKRQNASYWQGGGWIDTQPTIDMRYFTKKQNPIKVNRRRFKGTVI